MKPTAEPWLPLLNFLLVQAAHLRLQGSQQRLQWPVFKKVIQLSIEFRTPEALHKGMVDVVSVSPEFLDSSDAVEDYRMLLESCLQAEADGSQLCRLLVQDSPILRSAFNDWCSANDDLLKTINWRLQMLTEETVSSKNDPCRIFHSKEKIQFRS